MRMSYFWVFQIVYMGVTIYAPALALSAVTPIKLDWAIALTSLICTLYTAAVRNNYMIVS